MSVVVLTMIGRWGNQAMQYLFARAWAEKTGSEFQCCDWIGNKIFELNDRPITTKGLPCKSELDLKEGDTDFTFYGYAQNQKAMIYTKKQAQEWLKFRPEILDAIRELKLNQLNETLVAHRRVGDFKGYLYPIVGLGSYIKACEKYKLDKFRLRVVSDAIPYKDGRFSGEFEFLPDFYRLMQAHILLRGNSSFSWVAALLGNGVVLSPVIDGLEGGKEHDDVEFVIGNHPRLSNLDFCSDLHLPK